MWGDILSTVGGVQYSGGISWVPWGLSWVPWGDIMMYVGGYHEYRRGCSVPWGEKSIVIWVPHGTEHPHGTHDIPPHASWYPPTVLKFQRMVSPGTEHPPRYSWYPPTCIMISPTVLNIPHGTQDNLPRYSWYPTTVLNTPRYSRYPPHLSWYPPTVLNTPTVLKISPTVLMISPHGTHDIPPRYWTPPTVLHTHYTGWRQGTKLVHITYLPLSFPHQERFAFKREST